LKKENVTENSKKDSVDLNARQEHFEKITQHFFSPGKTARSLDDCLINKKGKVKVLPSRLFIVF